MKRYWLFMYPDYYPEGGMNDFFCQMDDLDEITAVAITEENRSRCDPCADVMFGHILDAVSLEIIYENKTGETCRYPLNLDARQDSMGE